MLYTPTRPTEDCVSRCSGIDTPKEVEIKGLWGSRSLIREFFVEQVAFELCGRTK